MAVYADFPYYQDFYCGTSITDAAAFRTAAARASDYIDNVTFGRLASNIPEPFAEPVKKCACELAEGYTATYKLITRNPNSLPEHEITRRFFQIGRAHV